MSARPLVAMVAALACAAACQVKPATTASPGPRRPASAAPAGAKTATPKPATTATPKPAPLVAAPDTRALSGTVAIDAAYAVARGGGRRLGEGVAFGADAPAPAGTSLIAPGGAALLSNHGAGTVALDPAPFRLQQAVTASLLPAAGMIVGVLDLAAGELLPIGLDPAGQPVRAVYTDAAGRFTVNLPAARDNVVVLAVAPGAADARLAYEQVVQPEAEAVAVDEDTATTVRFLREALAVRMRRLLVAPDVDAALTSITGTHFPEGLRAAIVGVATELNVAGRDAGLRAAPAAEVDRVASRLAELVLARVDLAAVEVSKDTAPTWLGAPIPAVATLVSLMGQLRAVGDLKLAADPAYFDKTSWVQAANAARGAAPPYAIRKGADLGDFMMRAYLLSGLNSYDEITAIIRELGPEHFPAVPGYARVTSEDDRVADTLSSSAVAVTQAMLFAFMLDQTTHDAALAAVRSVAP